ncbi:MAG: adenylosuccinate lyase [Candidatus Bathyarchaeota archaeon]
MLILPIDSGRYCTPEMAGVFDEESRLQKMLDAEAALAWALAKVGIIPRKDAETISRKASTKYVKLSRMKEIEDRIQHDIMAMVEALAEVCGESGGYVHLGATSNDINDTATALQFKDAFSVIIPKLVNLERTLMDKTEKYKKTLMIGRTHGQHALPITLGLKFAVWMMEISRHIERLMQCRERTLVGKFTGAVGTQAGMGKKGVIVQKLVMKKLGLKPVEVSTQIVQRDRYAELICCLALIASTLDKFSTEIRELQRPEIGELSEPFDMKKQVGSSTMPHKMNPIKSERICGLAKFMRGLVIPALENVPNWQERDLTHSSCERIIIPSGFILLDYMLNLMNKILPQLNVDERRMIENMKITQGRFMSESVMLKLTKKGVSRQEAHQIVRRLSIKSLVEKREFKEILTEDNTLRRYLSRKEINETLDPKNYLGTTLEQIETATSSIKERLHIKID